MKYLRKFQLFESIIPYEFTYSGKQGDRYIYYFEDDFNNQFKVEFDHLPQNRCEMRYLVKDGDNWTYKEVSTNIWRLTHTLLGEILIDFINDNSWCKHIFIKGLGSKVEKSEITRRTMTFHRYLSNNTPIGWDLDTYKNEIYLK